jgi:GxxExxY protein
MGRIILPQLSYRIMGILFAVHNELGPGYMEKHYQRAIRGRLKKEGKNFNEQIRVPICEENHIGCYYIDFVIENKIVLEIKAVPRFSRANILQVLRYLKETGLELGILATFARKELVYRRILRGYRN